MKLFLSLVVLFSSISAFAGQKFICKEINGSKKLVLTQVSTTPVRGGIKSQFKLEIFERNSSRPVYAAPVIVQTEDVMVAFENKAQQLSGMIYLDELDQTYVRIGRSELSFDCN